MKQKLIRFIAMLIAIFLPHIFITGLGNKDWMPECEKALQAHPEFVDIEDKWTDKLGESYEINLTSGRTIGFKCIDLRTGGGKYAGLVSIGEFNLSGRVKYKEKTSWKDTYGYQVRFQDLSRLLGIKIETMIDCIDNYNQLYELAKMLAREQFNIGWSAMPEIWYQWDTPLVKQFSGYIFTENREAKIITSAIYDCSQAYWANKVLEDEKFRRSLGLE